MVVAGFATVIAVGPVATAETVVTEGDILIVSGKIIDTERFSEII